MTWRFAGAVVDNGRRECACFIVVLDHHGELLSADVISNDKYEPYYLDPHDTRKALRELAPPARAVLAFEEPDEPMHDLSPLELRAMGYNLGLLTGTAAAYDILFYTTGPNVWRTDIRSAYRLGRRFGEDRRGEKVLAKLAVTLMPGIELLADQNPRFAHAALLARWLMIRLDLEARAAMTASLRVHAMDRYVAPNVHPGEREARALRLERWRRKNLPHIIARKAIRMARQEPQDHSRVLEYLEKCAGYGTYLPDIFRKELSEMLGIEETLLPAPSHELPTGGSADGQ